MTWALDGVAQWIGRRPVNPGVAGSIPSLGHMPGLQAMSSVEGTARGNHTLMFLSLSSLYLLPSLKINKILKKKSDWVPP